MCDLHEEEALALFGEDARDVLELMAALDGLERTDQKTRERVLLSRERQEGSVS